MSKVNKQKMSNLLYYDKKYDNKYDNSWSIWILYAHQKWANQFNLH